MYYVPINIDELGGFPHRARPNTLCDGTFDLPLVAGGVAKALPLPYQDWRRGDTAGKLPRLT